MCGWVASVDQLMQHERDIGSNMGSVNDDVSIKVLTPADLANYAKVPIRFSASSRLCVDSLLSDGTPFVEVPAEPFEKDYDALEHPTQWASRFDMSKWLIVRAAFGDSAAGGCIVAWNTPGVDMLEGRLDLAVIWDIRVDPAWRGKGIGRLLFDFASSWAILRGCTELKIETQDINVGACRFYRAMGCSVSEVFPDAYDDCPGEAQIIWRIII